MSNSIFDTNDDWVGCDPADDGEGEVHHAVPSQRRQGPAHRLLRGLNKRAAAREAHTQLMMEFQQRHERVEEALRFSPEIEARLQEFREKARRDATERKARIDARYQKARNEHERRQTAAQQDKQKQQLPRLLPPVAVMSLIPQSPPLPPPSPTVSAPSPPPAPPAPVPTVTKSAPPPTVTPLAAAERSEHVPQALPKRGKMQMRLSPIKLGSVATAASPVPTRLNKRSSTRLRQDSITQDSAEPVERLDIALAAVERAQEDLRKIDIARLKSLNALSKARRVLATAVARSGTDVGRHFTREIHTIQCFVLAKLSARAVARRRRCSTTKLVVDTVELVLMDAVTTLTRCYVLNDLSAQSPTPEPSMSSAQTGSDDYTDGDSTGGDEEVPEPDNAFDDGDRDDLSATKSFHDDVE